MLRPDAGDTHLIAPPEDRSISPETHKAMMEAFWREISRCLALPMK
jgi:hypothetical protein